MKKIKYLILLILTLISIGIAAGCNQVKITQELLESLIFEDATFEYTGETYSIKVQNVPEGVIVNYVGNNKVYPGEYEVNANITYEDLAVIKTAKLTINPKTSIISAEENQTCFIYGSNFKPKYTIDSNAQGVDFKYYKDGVEVDVSALTTPGTYTVDIIAKKNMFYAETVKTITLTTMNSMFGLSYLDHEVIYDGNEHVLELTGTIPTGYSVEYENNKGTESGAYYALAHIKDSKGNVVETHTAVLDIVNPENETFNEYLDMFFVEYLKEDQLSVNIFCENPEDFGLSHYAAEWYSYEASTDEEKAEYKAYLEELLEELEGFKNDRLSKLQWVAYNKVSDFLYENISLYEVDDIEFLNLRYVDQFGGYVADFSTYMEAYSLYSEQEVEDIVSYIQSTKTAFPSYLDYLEDRTNAGYALSDFTITKMQEYLDNILINKDSYYLVSYLCDKIDALTFLNADEKTNYKTQVENEMKDCFMVGVAALKNGLDNYKGKLAKEDEGYLAKYEDGKKVYLSSLDSLLGINDFDVEAYIKEIDSAFDKASSKYMSILRSIASAHGFSYVNEVEEFVNKSIIYGGTPDEMMEYLKEFAPTIVPNLINNPTINFKYMDLASGEASNAVAYYMKSSLDNSGSEYITLNPVKLEDGNDTLGTLAHEGYPGHLYAYVHSKEIGQHNLSTIMTSTAHGEGWATYVELKLYEYAKENSNDDAFKQAMDYLIANQSLGFLLETRLDIGIHYEGWTVKAVAKYLNRKGYNGDAAQEIYDLLIETPSQYAAYGYGKLYFVNLHNEAKKILGAHYNEIEFNAMIHSRGWTNLGELENTYIEYMKAKCHKCGIEYQG